MERGEREKKKVKVIKLIGNCGEPISPALSKMVCRLSNKHIRGWRIRTKINVRSEELNGESN